MKKLFKILLLFLIPVHVFGQVSMAVENLFPCQDVNGQPIHGCFVVSDAQGDWHSAYKGQQDCINGNIITPYHCHSNNLIVYTDTIYNACSKVKCATDVAALQTLDCEVGDLIRLDNDAEYVIEISTVSNYNNGNTDNCAVVSVPCGFAVLQPDDEHYRIDWFGDTNTEVEINKSIEFAQATGFDVISKVNEKYITSNEIVLLSDVHLDFNRSEIIGSSRSVFEAIGQHDIDVEGFRITSAATSNFGVRIQDCENIELEDFEVRNVGDGTNSVYGVYVENTPNVKISDFVIDSLLTDRISRGIEIIDVSGERSIAHIERGTISNIEHVGTGTKDTDGIFVGAVVGETPSIAYIDNINMWEITKRFYKTISGVMYISNSHCWNYSKPMFHYCSFQSESQGTKIENSSFETSGTGTVQRGISIGVSSSATTTGAIDEGVDNITIRNTDMVSDTNSGGGVDIKAVSKNIKIQECTFVNFRAAVGGLLRGSLSNSIISDNVFENVTEDVIRVDTFYNNIVSNNIVVGGVQSNQYFLTVYDNQNHPVSIFDRNIIGTDRHHRLIAGTGDLVSSFTTETHEGEKHLKIYASDAAADADLLLLSGEKYLITGQREVRIKP